jgi:hypothetical protein
MKSLLLAVRRHVRSFLRSLQGKVTAKITKLLDRRPAVKRGLLVLVLYGLIGLPLTAAFGGVFAAIWALMLGCLFLGMGAERAAISWDSMFALPPLRSFQFWRWQALERKRFMAVLSALTGGVLLTSIWGLVQ